MKSIHEFHSRLSRMSGYAEHLNRVEAHLLGASPDLEPDAIESILIAMRSVRDYAQESGVESAGRLVDSIEATMVLVKSDLKFDLRMADALLDAVDYLRAILMTSALTSTMDGRAA